MSILESFFLQGGRRRNDRDRLDLRRKTRSLRMELWSTTTLQGGKSRKAPSQGLENSSKRKEAEEEGALGRRQVSNTMDHRRQQLTQC